MRLMSDLEARAADPRLAGSIDHDHFRAVARLERAKAMRDLGAALARWISARVRPARATREVKRSFRQA